MKCISKLRKYACTLSYQDSSCCESNTFGKNGCLFQICEDCHADMFPEVRDFVNQDLPLLYLLKVYSLVECMDFFHISHDCNSKNELSSTLKEVYFLDML